MRGRQVLQCALFCILGLSACKPVASGAGKGAAANPAAPFSYAELLERHDRAVRAAQEDVRRKPDDVQALEELALACLQRGQLGADFKDYAAADEALKHAFAVADELHAPIRTRLHLALFLHQLPQAQADLAILGRRYRVRDSAEFASNQAELAFQQGRYAEAAAGLRRSLDIQESSGALIRLSVYHARLGHEREAAALLDRVEKLDHSDTPYLRAWLEVQRGLLRLDRGYWEQADEFFRHAEMLLPGWWLPRGYRAEVLAFQGQREAALALYQELVAQTGDPEFMDAIARLQREGPDPAAAQAWIERADQVHHERMQALPEASYGHALEHFLQFGRPDQTLELARRNAELRPNGEARIRYAQALAKAGQAAAAAREIEAVLASEWNTAELHALAAQIYAALGRREDADRERAAALAMNPRALRMYLLSQPAQAQTID